MNGTVILDIDEVLNVSKPQAGFDLLKELEGGRTIEELEIGELFSLEACQALSQVNVELGGQVRFTISSSWREHFSRQQLQMIFELGGLSVVAGRLHDGAAWCCPTVSPGPYPAWSSPTREEEIRLWLRFHHAGEPIVVIDDEDSGWSITPEKIGADHRLAGRVVLCSLGVGLTAEHVPAIVGALRRPV